MGNTLGRETLELPLVYQRTDKSEKSSPRSPVDVIIPLPLLNDGFYEYSTHGLVPLSPSKVKEFKFKQLKNGKKINFCSKKVVKVSPNVGLLEQTESLRLCCNYLTTIPMEIGYLKNLRVLMLSRNKLVALPETIGCLVNLEELHLRGNLLTQLPSSIGLLKKLKVLVLRKNGLTELPHELSNLENLTELDVASNPIKAIPSEITALSSIKMINTDNCPLLQEIPDEYFDAPVPSLRELAARIIVRHRLSIPRATSEYIQDYLSSSHECSFCKGPYFETYVDRMRFSERTEPRIPIVYRLCEAHWNNEEQRIHALFTYPPPTGSGRSTPKTSPPSSPMLRLRLRRGSSVPQIRFNQLPKAPSLPSIRHRRASFL